MPNESLILFIISIANVWVISCFAIVCWLESHKGAVESIIPSLSLSHISFIWPLQFSSYWFNKSQHSEAPGFILELSSLQSFPTEVQVEGVPIFCILESQ